MCTRGHTFALPSSTLLQKWGFRVEGVHSDRDANAHPPCENLTFWQKCWKVVQKCGLECTCSSQILFANSLVWCSFKINKKVGRRTVPRMRGAKTGTLKMRITIRKSISMARSMPGYAWRGFLTSTPYPLEWTIWREFTHLPQIMVLLY